MSRSNCSVCGDDHPILGIPGGHMHEEKLCHYCWMWFAAASLQPGGPTWGRDQIGPLRWLERARAANWPDAPLLRLLLEIDPASDVGDPVFHWEEEMPGPIDRCPCCFCDICMDSTGDIHVHGPLGIDFIDHCDECSPKTDSARPSDTSG